MKLKDKTILITGASAGIGKSMAIRAAKDGAYVILAARNLEKLQQVAEEVESLGGKSRVIRCDVSKIEDIKNLFLEATNDGQTIDVVFNNAGLGFIAPIYELTTEQIVQIINVNVLGMIMVSKFASEVFTRQKSGHLIMTSSVAGLVTVPQWSVYVASKWAITGFASCIRPELKPFGVKVTTIHPGIVKTEFFDKEKANIDYTALGGEGITAEDVAEAVYEAIFTDKKKVILPAEAKIYAGMYQHLPELTEDMLSKRAGSIEYHLEIPEDEEEFDYIKSSGE